MGMDARIDIAGLWGHMAHLETGHFSYLRLWKGGCVCGMGWWVGEI